MSEVPAKVIEIKTNRNFLSPVELVAHRHAEIETSKVGLKRTKVEGTAIESEELQNAYANLRNQLCALRIERGGGRALAVWHEDQQAAEVLRKDGKFESFGYSLKGKRYLEYYEALFLLELNRLQLEYCGMIVSIEQAYVLLLGEAECEKYNRYLVYSTLSRAGYIVTQHQRYLPNAATTVHPVTDEDCIWAILKETVSNQAVPPRIKASTHYKAAQAKMALLKQQIISQTSVDTEKDIPTEFQFETRKRRAQSEPHDEAVKRQKTCSTSLIDILKEDQSYLKFREIFEKFDIVKLQQDNEPINGIVEMRSFEISFDLHLHNEGFKSSAPKTPTLSVVILPANELFPSHDEINKCQREQLPHAVPLLIVSISESKQIQAFLYATS